jgi:hypothetical protein
MRIAFYAQASHLDEGSNHMIKFSKSIAAAVAAASMVATVAVSQQASAAPFVSGAVANAQTASTVKVGWHRGGWHRGGWGWGPGALIGGIVGGALIASAISEHRAAPRDMDRCARDFPDFSYRTGTFIDRRGVERVCPYLR